MMRLKTFFWLISVPFLITTLASCYVKNPILDPINVHGINDNMPNLALANLFTEVRSNLNAEGINITTDEHDLKKVNIDTYEKIYTRLTEISKIKSELIQLKNTLVPKKDRHEAFALTLHITEDLTKYQQPYKNFLINLDDPKIQSFVAKTNSIAAEIKENTFTFDSISQQQKWHIIDFLVDQSRSPETLVQGVDFHSEPTNIETNGKRIRVDVSSESQLTMDSMNDLLLYHSYLSVINTDEYDDEKNIEEGLRRISISTRSPANLSRSRIETILMCHMTAIPTTINNIIIGDESKLVEVFIRNQYVSYLHLDARVQSDIPENATCKELTKYVITLLP